MALGGLVLVRGVQHLLALETLLSLGRVAHPTALLTIVASLWATTLREQWLAERLLTDRRAAHEAQPVTGPALCFEVLATDGGVTLEGCVDTEPFTVGRSPDCAICVPHDFVSWHHGSVVRRGGRLYYRDESSTAGSAIEGAPCPPRAEQPLGASGEVVLAPGAGDEGEVRVRFVERGRGPEVTT